MTVLTDAVKTVATDCATIDKNRRTIACGLSRCTAAATWTHFYFDGGVNRYCSFHSPTRATGAYAKASHSPIVVDETVELKTVKAVR